MSSSNVLEQKKPKLISKILYKSNLNLCRGDIVCTHNDNVFGQAIRFMDGLWSKDDISEYNHCLVITGKDGGTFEALETIKRQNIFKAYAGVPVVIFRYDYMTGMMFDKGFSAIKDLEGKWYPAWRLALAVIPFLSKKIGTGKNLVCSEIAAQFLVGCGLRNFYPAMGKTPNDITDMCRNYKYFSVVAEGIIE